MTDPRYAAASLSMVLALRDAVVDVWRGAGSVVGTGALATAVWRRSSWLRAVARRPVEHRASEEAVAEVVYRDERDGYSPVEFEVDALVREAIWRAKVRLRRPFDSEAPACTDDVRNALLRAFRDAENTRTTRYPNSMLLFRELLRGERAVEVPGQSPKEIFRDDRIFSRLYANDAPSSAAVLDLRLSNLLVNRAPAVVRLILGMAPRGRDWFGPVSHAVLREAMRQAVRTDARAVGQAHLVMAMCAMDFHLARTGNRLVSSAVAVNRAARVLDAYDVDYLRVVRFRAPGSDGAELALAGQLPRYQIAGNLPLHAEVVDICNAAVAASRAGREQVGTSHLLFAIASDLGSTAAEMLRSLGVDVDAVAAQLAGELRS